MTSMLHNTAAWIVGPKSTPFIVKDAPYPCPRSDEVVIRTGAVVINPLDFKIQDHNPSVAGKPIQHPTILGADLAGTVVSVGGDVTTRKVGERVIANAPGVSTGNPSMSAFQQFVVLHESLAIPVPESVPFESAVVLPLACYTAMAGLFVPDQLGLSTAGLGDITATPPPADSTLLIWGGSSSVGCCAIQMAGAAGYEVYTVASKRNHALCLSIGATKVFDRASDNLVQLIVEALEDKIVVGALDCIVDGESTVNSCARILAQANGCKKVMTVHTPPQTKPVDGVVAQRVSIPALRETKMNDLLHAWMAQALVDTTLQCKPDPVVVGDGLESIQLGLDTLRKGVSATKIVVRLSNST